MRLLLWGRGWGRIGGMEWGGGSTRVQAFLTMVSPIGALLGSRQCIPQLGYSSQAWLEGVVLIYSGTGLP